MASETTYLLKKLQSREDNEKREGVSPATSPLGQATYLDTAQETETGSPIRALKGSVPHIDK